MPRWPAGLHYYAGALPNYGGRNRRIDRAPMEWYTGIQRQIPLNDGQGQALVPASGTVTVRIGPAGLGTVWYPAAVTVSTTTGVNDASVCNIYAGPAGLVTPTTLLGTIPSGGAGVLAAAVPPLPVGWFLAAVWTGAKQGDVAAVNVTGSKDARVIG
jgi:hypothetical protein